MSHTKRIVAITPKELFDTDHGSFIKLRHPRYGNDSLFYLKSDDLSLWEIQRHSDKHRSWFIGNSVKSDGSLHFFTPFDPLFVAIPCMKKKKARFCTLDTILEDSEYPEIKQMTDSKRLVERLHLIADVKTTSGFKVARFSESKTLDWLENRFQKIENVLKANDIVCHSEGVSQASCWRSGEASDPEAIRQYAFGILSEYLSDDIASLLRERLNIATSKVEKGETNQENGLEALKKSDVVSDGTEENMENGLPPPKKRKSNDVQQVNDYEKIFKPLMEGKKEASEKAGKPKLKKQPGMQSITNFFTKK